MFAIMLLCLLTSNKFSHRHCNLKSNAMKSITKVEFTESETALRPYLTKQSINDKLYGNLSNIDISAQLFYQDILLSLSIRSLPSQSSIKITELEEFLLNCTAESFSSNISENLKIIIQTALRFFVYDHHDILKSLDIFNRNPYLCKWIYEESFIRVNSNQIICPRNIGIEVVERLQNSHLVGVAGPGSKLSHISRDRLNIVDLTNFPLLHSQCVNDRDFDVKVARDRVIIDENLENQTFIDCTGLYKNIKIMLSTDLSDVKPWIMRRSMLLNDYIHSKPSDHSIHSELSTSYAPHLVAIKNAYVNSWGYIFDHNNWYIHGGCSDRSWHHPPMELFLKSDLKIANFSDTPILSLIHPFPAMFYHEFIELHAMLVMCLPLLIAHPNITILVNKELKHSRLFPLLKLHNIDIDNYNFISFKEFKQQSTQIKKQLKQMKQSHHQSKSRKRKQSVDTMSDNRGNTNKRMLQSSGDAVNSTDTDDALMSALEYRSIRRTIELQTLKLQTQARVESTNSIYYSSYIITPLSLYCQHISRGVTKTLRKGYEKLEYWNLDSTLNQAGDGRTSLDDNHREPSGIIVYDRYNLRPKRFLVEGNEIFHALTVKYSGKRVGHDRITVSMFYGNETLEETIKVFRNCKVLIAAHGGGQANQLFMEPNSIVIEVRPDSWPVPCYIDIADNVGLEHYLVTISQSGRVEELHVNLTEFLPNLYHLIDSKMIVNSRISTTI